MGQLMNYDLQNFNCNVYVETGTGGGVTLGKAYASIAECYSVDLDLEIVNRAREIYPKATIEVGYSTEILEKWLSGGKFLESDRILFFLDAHFPGADYRGAEYSVSDRHAVPLEEELRLIKKYRPKGNNFIICDDARIYFLGPFKNGNVEHLQVPGGLKFLGDLFNFKQISINFDDEGYIEIDDQKI